MKRAFTLVEIAVVLATLLILMPMIYALVRRIEEAHELAAWHLSTAEMITDVAEELQLDARRGTPLPGEVAWDVCGVRYVVREEVLVRLDACTGDRALARHVESVAWAPGGVELTFVRRMRPGNAVRTQVLLPVETP